jgi:thioredoxin reductase (NADPH)
MTTADVIVVGAGPAGLSSSITLASEGRSVILLEKSSKAGGQAGTSSLIENVPPFAAGFSGKHFADESCKQCEKFGVDIHSNTEAIGIVPACGAYTVLTSRGRYQCRAVLLALGLHNRWLGVPGEALPHVYHGMDMEALDDACNRHVVLVGGGNSVGQAALSYLGRGAQVTIIARRSLQETMSQYLVNRIRSRVVIEYGEVQGFRQRQDKLVARVVSPSSNIEVWDIDCVHIFIGQEPSTDWLPRLVARDEKGFILTGKRYETSLPGVFAIGDVTHDAVRRVACAIGDGNRVVPQIHEFLGQDYQACRVA